MDTALIGALVASRAGALQQQIATSVLKQNINSEKAVLQLLQPAPQASSTANLAPGAGANLDISV
jgi:hypothetical protein